MSIYLECINGSLDTVKTLVLKGAKINKKIRTKKHVYY